MNINIPYKLYSEVVDVLEKRQFIPYDDGETEEEDNDYEVIDVLRKLRNFRAEKEHWIDRIPSRLKEGLVKYRDRGTPTGGFLRAFLSNDLAEAINTADEDSIANLRPLYWWCVRFLPGEAWGSDDRVRTWIQCHGLAGRSDMEWWPMRRLNELREIGRDSEL